MLTGMELMGCPNLAVPAEVMQHVVLVESANNPYAIGVVGGALVRQPQRLDEALATVQMLVEGGHNFSVGVAQINRNNLAKYGIDSYEKAFDTCTNLAAASRILADCYSSAGGDWGKSFSCYYSGNFTTGYRDGYVQKIYESMSRSARSISVAGFAAPIPLISDAKTGKVYGDSQLPPVNTAAYRVAIRSTPTESNARPEAPPRRMTASMLAAPAASPTSATVSNSDVFVPQVRGPNEPKQETNSTPLTAPQTPTSQQSNAISDQHIAPTHEEIDTSFVF